MQFHRDLLLLADDSASVALSSLSCPAAEVTQYLQATQRPVNTLCSSRKTEFAWNMALCLLAMRAVVSRSKKNKSFCFLGLCPIHKFKIFNLACS